MKLLRLAHLRADEALVVAEVEIGFRAVFGHEHFAVLERAHRAGVDVDVGIELEHGDFEAARFEDRGERSGGNALAKGGHYAAGDENIFGHRWMLAGKTDYTVRPPREAPSAANAPPAISRSRPASARSARKHPSAARAPSRSAFPSGTDGCPRSIRSARPPHAPSPRARPGESPSNACPR